MDLDQLYRIETAHYRPAIAKSGGRDSPGGMQWISFVTGSATYWA